jgi:ubiquinone biosynthesis protein
MSLSLRPEHVRRYRDVARLLLKYGRGDLVPDGSSAVTDITDRSDDAAADAAELAGELETLGPTFVKLGQLLSTRADLLPAPYLEALGRLQDDVEPMPAAEVTRIIEAELGVRLSKGFGAFDPEPLAAASLAQVHRAEMRDGRPVAVKVQRPDIEPRIRDDLDAIAEIAGLVDRHSEIGRRFGFAGMVEEFTHSMLQELDFRREARNLVVFGENLAKFDRIVVPQPIEDFTTTRVLTMELVAGRKVTAVSPQRLLEVDGDALVSELFSAYLEQVLVHGFFHADPHPGNILLTDDGRLAIVDLGMVARVSGELQERLLKLLVAIGDGDGDSAAEVARELGERRPDVDVDEARLHRRVATLVADEQGSSLGGLSAGAILTQLSRIAGECGLRPAPELTMLGKAMLNLDETARVLAPNLRPETVIRDRIEGIVRRRMLHAVSPSNVVSAALDAKEFAEKLPGRVNRVMEALAEGTLNLNVTGIDQDALMRHIRKVANRITLGLVLAALILGAAMLVRVPTSSKLFGYPTLAIVLFLLAATGAGALFAIILLGDRRD